MRSLSHFTFLLVVLALLATGCGLFASKSDYLAHREVKLAKSEEMALVKKRAYLDEHPNGEWAQEHRADLTSQEEVIYERGKSSFDGLNYYLQLYPGGVHAAEAKRRMGALASVKGSKESARKFDREVRHERREDTLENRRLWARDTISYWTKVFGELSRWGSPISVVAKNNDEFREAFGRTPEPVCNKEQCLKGYSLDYAIPVPGATRIERDMALIVRLQIAEGNLVGAQILIPNHGFSRWYELEEQVLITDEDPTSRQKAISWTKNALTEIFETKLAARDIKAPSAISAFRFDTSGLEIKIPADEEGVEPVSPMPGPAYGFKKTAAYIIFAGNDDYGVAYDGILFRKR